MADPKPKPKPDEAKDYTPKPPRQVQDQIAAADALRAELETAPPINDETATPPGEPPPSEPAASPRPAAPVVPPPAEEEESWEQRYKSQAGRYDQMVKNNQQMAERINQLESLVASMRVRGAEPVEERPDAAVPKLKPKLVTDQEAADYGEEFLTVVGKRAKEEYAPEFEELADRLKRLEGRVEGVGTVMQQTKTEELWGNLSKEVEDWRNINHSPEFKTWLAQPDVFSGRRRHDMLVEAFSRHDAPRVVAFFKGFLAEAAGLPQNPQARTPSAPPLAPNGNGSGKPSLEQFAAPGRARSAPQELPPDKPIYTAAWIAKFSADKLLGKYRGREADAEAIEQDIYRAQHEGRIQ